MYRAGVAAPFQQNNTTEREDVPAAIATGGGSCRATADAMMAVSRPTPSATPSLGDRVQRTRATMRNIHNN